MMVLHEEEKALKRQKLDTDVSHQLEHIRAVIRGIKYSGDDNVQARELLNIRRQLQALLKDTHSTTYLEVN